MRIITLWQPWATLWVLGIKQNETRSFKCSYRGELAVHAAKRSLDATGKQLLDYLFNDFGISINPDNLPYGAIVGWGELTQCQPTTDVETSDMEYACGNWSEGRYAWTLEDRNVIKTPIPLRGKQGMTTLDSEVAERIKQVRLVPEEKYPQYYCIGRIKV